MTATSDPGAGGVRPGELRPGDDGDQTVRVFAYGSLMYEPELPGEIVRVEAARLDGYRRALNKLSRARGCRRDERCWPHVVAPPRFTEDTRQLSLALGTTRDAGASTHGLLLHYPAAARERLYRELDLREGHQGGAPIHAQHYLRVDVDVRVVSGLVRGVTYVSNPDGPAHVNGLTLAEQARVLLAATPLGDGGRARGLHYVTRARATASTHGLPTPVLDEILEVVSREHG